MSKDNTLFEVERKRIFQGRVEDFIKTLETQGFHSHDTLHEIDTYYSRADVDFMKTVECLRIRERDGFAEITYKPASSRDTHTSDDIIIKPETNLPISYSDIIIAKQLFVNIGMVRLVEVDKLRHTFLSSQYTNLVISVDEIKGAGVFIETEVTSSDSSEALRIINEVEILLKVNKLAIETKPYRDICMSNGI